MTLRDDGAGSVASADQLLATAAAAWVAEHPHEHDPYDPAGRACCEHYSSAANEFLHAAERAWLDASHRTP